MATVIETEISDSALWITFRETEERRPCTLDYGVMDQLDKAIDIAERDESVRAVVVRAASEKFFVVGANINFLEQMTPEGMLPWVERGFRVFGRLQTLPVPSIASVAGAAMGGGLELATSCDFILSGDKAKYASPEAGLGVLTGWGGSYRLPLLVGAPFAKQMYFTGKAITAEKALAVGLVNEVVPSAELDAFTRETVKEIAANDRLAIGLYKEIVNNHIYYRNDAARQAEQANSVVCMHSPTTKERMEKFFASRKK